MSHPPFHRGASNCLLLRVCDSVGISMVGSFQFSSLEVEGLHSNTLGRGSEDPVKGLLGNICTTASSAV